MTPSDQELMARFTGERSEDAFTELVNRHVNLVYSAAFRQVRAAQLAEEVCQTVFSNLACHASKLKPDTVLTAWLYQVTRRAAIDVVRREARRQAREQIAFEMSNTSDSSSDWTRIEPLLDEAVHSLREAERTALLLRYFENKCLREVGEAMGTSEDAAQKRVSRALENLRAYFAKREVAVEAGTLAVLLSASAASGAPAGLAGAVSAGALTGAAALSTSTAISITETIAMTTLQKTVVSLVIAGAVVTALYQTNEASQFRREAQTLRKQQQEQQAHLAEQLQAMQLERDRATNRLAQLTDEIAALKKAPSDTMRLKGEVGRLRRENVEIGSSSPLSKVSANPEAVKMMREQQKMGMGMIYKPFAKTANLTPEQTEKLNDLLADHIMTNVGHVTTCLRDKAAPEQVDEVFAAQDTALEEQVRELLGEDAAAQFQDYTRDILGALSAEQFKSMMVGTDEEKAAKAKQLGQAIQEAARLAVSNAGLPADYQTVPILNFRNIVSEQEADRSLKLLEEIYRNAAGKSGSFLNGEELAKFEEFKAKAISNSRGALSLNRSMMAPISN